MYINLQLALSKHVTHYMMKNKMALVIVLLSSDSIGVGKVYFFLIKGRLHQYKNTGFRQCPQHTYTHTYNNRTTFTHNYIAKDLYNVLNCSSFLVAYKRGFREFHNCVPRK